jgi:Na+:H+ antiporter
MGEFLGRSLFIPIFFVVTGFLINPITLVYGIFRQLLARYLHHRCPARRQVDSRLAHNTLGAAGQRLLDDRMFNVVLLLVFATSVLGPFD